MASDLEQRYPVMSGCCKECQDYGDFFKPPRHILLEESDRELVLLNSSRKGHLECVKACLAAGADVNYSSYYHTPYRTPLSCAIDSRNDECVDFLIKAGSRVTEEDLFTGAMKGNERCVNLIVKAGGDATEMLFYAVGCGPKNVNLLIKAGADVNTYGIFEIALLSGSVQCVKFYPCCRS